MLITSLPFVNHIRFKDLLSSQRTGEQPEAPARGLQLAGLIPVSSMDEQTERIFFVVH